MGVITIIKPDGSTEYTVRPTHAYTGTCSTSGSTAAKAVVISPDLSNFFQDDLRISVYFYYANTADNPTLKINNGAAKSIYKGGSTPIPKELLTVGYHDFIYKSGGWYYVSSYIDTNTTYAQISSSNTNTNASYTVPGAGSSTGNFLRGDGTWQTPTNTTYGAVSTSSAGLAPTLPGGTSSFLRGDGSWAVPPDNNTTYAKLSSLDTNTAGSYVVKGAGANTNYFLRGDGTWMPKCAVGGSENASSDTYHKIYYESSVTNNNGLLLIKFKDRHGATLAISTLVNGTIYNFVFRTDTPAYSTRFALKDDTTASAVSFMTSEGNEVWFGGKTMPLIPTNMVLQFKKDSSGLKYVGPSNLYNMLSSTNISETLGHVVKGAGANTGHFLRGDGEWKIPTDTTYAKLSSSNTNTAGSYVVKGAGSNTGYFLRGDGSWQPVSGGGGGGTTYDYISASNTSPNTSYVVRGAGAKTDCFLRGDGKWKTPSNTTYEKLSSSNTNTAGSYVVKGAGSNTGYFLRGDGSWQPVSGGGGGGTTYDYISASNTSTNTSYVVRGAGANTDCFLRGDGYWGMIHEFTGATSTSDGINGIVPKPVTGEQYRALLGDGGWHHLPISNKIVQEFECDALENASYPEVMNFVALKIQTALGAAIAHIQMYASTQEILFKFNGRMSNFDGQSELMLIEILAAFDTIARQFLDGKAMKYHITVNFEFTPHDKYYENDVSIPQVHISKDNKFEIIETLDNDNKKTLAYDEKSDTLSIRELQGNFLNILTYRIDCHDVSLNPNVIQYSKGTQISLKQYAMIYHIYNPVVY